MITGRIAPYSIIGLSQPATRRSSLREVCAENDPTPLFLKRTKLPDMLKRLIVAGFVAVALLAGVLIGVACTYALMRRVNHNWMQLTREHHGLAYSNEVFVDVDIPLPDLKDPDGQAKFVDRGVGKGTELGFVVKVRMDNLDTSKLPEKYKKSRPWGNLTLGPTTSVTYTAHLEFTLKDADGFVLMTTKSDSSYVESGEENVIQGIALDAIPDPLVRRTKSIVMQLVLDKCETCLP
jgi:hypothetical protein